MNAKTEKLLHQNKKAAAAPHLNTPAFCHHHLCYFNMVEHGTQ